MFQQTTRNPQYGPQGEPYCVEFTWDGGDGVDWYWTATEAQDARDALLADLPGCRVRVLGLPTTIAGGGIGPDETLDGRD